MIKLSTKIALILFISGIMTACDSGYKFEKGHWVWISYNEAFGRQVIKLDSVDNESFKVLTNKDYALDKNSVYYKIRRIKDADPRTFNIINEFGYSKDKNNVYLVGIDCEKVIFADPETFKTLDFPYSKDNNNVYCGTIPLKLNAEEVNEFTVTNEDTLMAGMCSTIRLSSFIESNPEYSWLDTLKIDWVIVGEDGAGKTKTRKFKGFKDITEKK